MDLNNKVKDSIDDFKQKIENLKQKIDLEKDDAIEEFEIQKEKLQKWINENGINSETFKNKTDITKLQLKIALEELQHQLSLGKIEGEDAIKKQSEIINEKINRLKNEIEKDKNINSFKHEAHSTLVELTDTFEILSLKFKYEVEDGKELWEEKKKELSKEIDSWNDKFEQLKNKSSDKIDDVSSEASKLWNSLKKSINF
jgi:translation elongation factor EF-G